MSKEYVVPLEEAHKMLRVQASEFKLPPYLSGKIGIDMEKTSKLMNIGGIGIIFLGNKEEDERPMPQIVGWDSRGSAYSGGVRSKSARNRIGYAETIQSAKGSEWRFINVEIDTDKVADEISRKNNESIHSPKAWIKPLNREIKGAILKQGIEFSLKPSVHLTDYMSDMVTAAMAAGWVYNTIDKEPIASAGFAGAVLMNQFSKIYGMMTNPIYRADVLYSSHIGRAAWAKLRAHTAFKSLLVPLKDN